VLQLQIAAVNQGILEPATVKTKKMKLNVSNYKNTV